LVSIAKNTDNLPSVLKEKTPGRWVLLAGFAAILYFCFRIMRPFLMPAFFALILSTLLSPAYLAVNRRLHNRRSFAALVIDAWLDPTNSPIVRRVQAWLPGSFRPESLQFGAQAQRIGIALLGVATGLAAGILNFLADYFIMVTVLFFLLRDSDYFAERLRAISPLSEQQENMFIERFRTVARATVLGNLATTLAQGTVSGLTFLVLGLANPILWGVLIALLSLIPLFGAALIWVPWTVYLFAKGSSGKAVILLVMQVAVVGSVDNIMRPLFIRGGAKMHTLVVFFSILGAVAYFGMTGILFGPLIFAIAIALLEFYIGPSKEPFVTGTM
jgi:predicted PurR-regulated permease PerM